MSKSYTPGLKILDKISIEKERVLPLIGEVHVKQDDEVVSDTVVASTKIPCSVARRSFSAIYTRNLSGNVSSESHANTTICCHIMTKVQSTAKSEELLPNGVFS